jgi:hypothetical protein
MKGACFSGFLLSALYPATKRGSFFDFHRRYFEMRALQFLEGKKTPLVKNAAKCFGFLRISVGI